MDHENSGHRALRQNRNGGYSTRGFALTAPRLSPRLAGGILRILTRRITPMITTDVYPGKDLGTLELTITDEMVQHYIKGLDEPNPWYTTASPFGGPVAPVIVYQQADSEFKGWYLDNLFGNLWRRQEWEIYAPTRVGQVLRCSARAADRYRRRDRD